MTGRRNILRAISAILLPAVFFPAPAAAREELQTVRIVLPYEGQPLFAGFYMAQARGFYRENHLRVELLYTDPRHQALDCLVEGKADFAVTSLTLALQGALSGRLRPVNLLQIIQQPSGLLITRHSDQLTSPAALNGKKIIYDSIEEAGNVETLLAGRRIKTAKLPITGAKLELFLNGYGDAVAGRYFDEYRRLLDAGMNHDEMNLLNFSELDRPIPEEGLYARREYFEAHRQLCAVLSKETLRGYRYAFMHPEETVEVIAAEMNRRRAEPRKSLLKWAVAALKDFVFPGNRNDRGRLEEGDYRNAAEQLFRRDERRALPDYRELVMDAEVKDAGR